MIRTVRVGSLQTNCYILTDERLKVCVIIDPGDEAGRIAGEIGSTAVKCIINTHGHADHIEANSLLKKKFSCPVLIHRLDAPMLSFAADKFIEDGEKISVGKLTLKIMHTPGHTPGSICLLCEGFMFTGDTLFCGSVGRWDMPGGDGQTLRESIKKLSRISGAVEIYPGHGPSCSMKDELLHNPFLSDFSLYE